MHTFEPKQRSQIYWPFRLLIGLLCIVLFCSGCDNLVNSSAPITGGSLSNVNSSPAPTKSPEQVTEAKPRYEMMKVEQIMQTMTLEEKLGQMLLVEYVGADYANTKLPAMITEGHVGGYLYQPGALVNRNFDPPADTIAGAAAVGSQAQRDAKIPLLIAIDQEGGNVNKLATFFGDAPSANDLAAAGNVDAVYAQATKYSQELKQVGINTDLAPVADVGPLSNLMNIRQFSNDPQVVTNDAGKFLDGLQKNDIVGTLKHFPGLGAVTQDPHLVIPHDTQSLAQVEARNFAPYKQMIHNNSPAMIMTTDIFLDAVDAQNPAELSSKVVTGILRQKLHYNGVIITDGIYMIERTGYMNAIPASVQAIIAGNDIVEGPYRSEDVMAIIAGLKQAIQQGQLSRAQVDQSVQRILLMKVQYGIIK